MSVGLMMGLVRPGMYQQPPLLTRLDIEDELRGMGVTRYRVTECRGIIKAQVPAKDIIAVRALYPRMACAVAFIVTVLPWWRCWFVRRQWSRA